MKMKHANSRKTAGRWHFRKAQLDCLGIRCQDNEAEIHSQPKNWEKPTFQEMPICAVFVSDVPSDAKIFLKKPGFPVFQKLWRTAFNAN